jgi:23S rRNA (cytosine1962-C5)-methyltransferase
VPAEPVLSLLESPDWVDYELLDCGNGSRLERFGPYTFIRPEHQAVWKPALPEGKWKSVHAIFQSTSEESGGHWKFLKPVEESWKMQYKGIQFQARTSNSRHVGVFPEQANHWDWINAQVRASKTSLRVLNLFGYTGLATLAAAQAGAQVTHVDASKKSVGWARENQALSGLEAKPIRWIIDDALKFVQREKRRGAQYDGLILDPPKFGRGPKGEVWEVFELLPTLLEGCREILSPKPAFFVITAYAIRASALSLFFAVKEMLAGYQGSLSTGELVVREKSKGRLLSAAIFVRWSAHQVESS